MDETVKQLKELDSSEFPDFHNLKKILDMGLWVLWVCKEKLNIKELSAQQISNIIKEVKELSIEKSRISNAFNRAGDKIHKKRENKILYYEIMKPGKDYLMSISDNKSINLLYFVPEKRFTSKRLLAKKILINLKGILKFIDPYVDIRTLDILKDLDNSEIRIITRLANLRENQKQRFLRELKDFMRENRNFRFKDYDRKDLHDRYIISQDSIILIGHSIKDLGAKESFAVVLDKDKNNDIYKILNSTFDKRWNQSIAIP